MHCAEIEISILYLPLPWRVGFYYTFIFPSFSKQSKLKQRECREPKYCDLLYPLANSEYVLQCSAVQCWCVPSRCNWTWWMVWRCPGWPSPCCAGPWLPEVRGCEQLPADWSPGEVTREAQCCGHRWSADKLLRAPGTRHIMRLFRDIGPLHRMDPRISNGLFELLKLNQKFALTLHHPIPNAWHRQTYSIDEKLKIFALLWNSLFGCRASPESCSDIFSNISFHG